MPLTNEAVIPIGNKDLWNQAFALPGSCKAWHNFGNYFYNPELALYMDDAKFGGAIPAFAKLQNSKKFFRAIRFWQWTGWFVSH